MVYKFPLKVPTYDVQSKEWTETVFEEREDFLTFTSSLIKEVGEYEFDESISEWNKHATYFNINKAYEGRKYPELTKDRKAWWNFEKRKCRKGVIYKNGEKTFYLSRFYYFWLNFLKIYDKVENDFVFPKIWDTHYDLSLCVVAAELDYKNIAILKKRQMGASLFFLALIINSYWFDRGSVLKLGASLGSYLGMDDGCWKTLDFYRSHLNEYTDWYRESTPDKVGSWIQQREAISHDGKKTNVGRKNSIKATSFEKSPTNGVGGPTTYFFHEEGGIAPKADVTFGYVDPAMRMGDIRTGVFIVSGSVGELSQCKPLEKWVRRPSSDFFSRKTKYFDETGTEANCGLFIPEQWSMLPYIDEYGNSLVKEAMEAIMKGRKIFEEEVKKGEKTEEDYRQYVSQHPINIKEAFAWRDESKWPIALLERQKDKILRGDVFMEYLDIERNEFGKPVFKKSNRIPLKYPTEKALPDKRACVIVHERPPENPEFNKYYASIDPVGEGKTLTSDSLFSITIWKMPVEKQIYEKSQIKIELEGDKMVASWTGRFDDINDTHEYASMLLEIYAAKSIVEANVSLFINYMILKKRQKYLIPKDEVVFLKEIQGSNATYEYGWKNTGRMFVDHLMSYGIESIKEVIYEDKDDTGKPTIKHYGVERIFDIWLIEEMLRYRLGENVDRMVSYCSLMAYIKLRIANFGYKKEKVYKDDLENNKNLYTLKGRGAFTNLERTNPKSLDGKYSVKRANFKNLH